MLSQPNCGFKRLLFLYISIFVDFNSFFFNLNMPKTRVLEGRFALIDIQWKYIIYLHHLSDCF